MTVFAEIDIPPYLSKGDILPVGSYLTFNHDQDPVLAAFVDDSDTVIHIEKYRDGTACAYPIAKEKINREEDFKGSLRWAQTPTGEFKSASPAAFFQLTDTDFLLSSNN